MYSDDVSLCTKELQDFHNRQYKIFFFFRARNAIFPLFVSTE